MLGPQSSLVTRRGTSILGAVVAAIAAVTSCLIAPATNAATINSDRARIAQIQQQISEQGAEIESLVGKVNEASAHLDSLREQTTTDEQILASDARAERAAQALVRQASVVAYIGSSGGWSSMSIYADTSSITQAMSGRHYLNSVNSHWDDSIARLELLNGRTEDDRRRLINEEANAQRVLDQLTRAQADANAAITAENETLTRVRASLTSSLINQKQQKDAQAQRAAEREIAAAVAAATQEQDAAPADAPQPVAAPQLVPPTIALPPPRPVTGGGYANPFRSVGGLSPERIDSGVDYSGVGPVYAIGTGVVLNVYAGDWPGGTFLAYQLSEGPAKGLVVYTAEDLNPQVSVGMTVTTNTVIGQMYGGPHGIEIGWADGSAIPNAMARSAGQYHGDNSTAFGYNFARFLQALGAPPGNLQNTPTGTLPAGWPRW